MEKQIEKENKWEKIRTKNKCLGEGLSLTVNSNTINEEDRLIVTQFAYDITERFESTIDR
jgi:hypothetical protein